jgi:pyruvate kinase
MTMLDMLDPSADDRIRRAAESVRQLLAATRAGERKQRRAIDVVPPVRHQSARNLAHYLAVRSQDLRPLQQELAHLSLSSLGRMEANVQHTLAGVATALARMQVGSAAAAAEAPATQPLSPGAAAALLAAHTVDLLGPPPPGRHARIMVTLPTEAMRDQGLLRDLLLAGMDIARINLAHDDEATWSAMVANLHAAEQAVGRRCRILVDLPGPKLRTGAILPGPQVLRARPRRDELGRVIEPASLVLLDPSVGPSVARGSRNGVELPLCEALACHAEPGDELRWIDARGRKRRAAVAAVESGKCIAWLERTSYWTPDVEVGLWRDGAHLTTARIGAIPALPGYLQLHAGDLLTITQDPQPGCAARIDASGQIIPARVACSLPEVFAVVAPGQRICFDDGRIVGEVIASSVEELTVRVTEVPPGGARLRAEKGINLPGLELPMGALTEEDIANLDWVAGHADLVGMSFVQRPADVLLLHQELERRGRSDLGIVLKIETAAAFQRLPDLLFAGLQSPPLGVMVARGDLAVEVGYARLAEVQEEILWLCEAAHLPVVWATQVLETMTKTGVPSRAEVTDAAMGVRAECVMLNKGSFVVASTQLLSNLLERMQHHHGKKRSLLRRLKVAGEPPPDGDLGCDAAGT